MLADVMIFFLFLSLIQIVASPSGFGTPYLNTNYTPLIVETRPMISKQVLSTFTCLTACLNQQDCSLAVFDKTDNQCALYNLFPIVEQELLPDDNSIVYLFQRTIQLSPSVSDTKWLMVRFNTTSPTKVVTVQSPRCLVMDIFGYLLTLETFSGNTYVNRYDRTSLTLVERTTPLMANTSIGMLTYYNGMLFVSSQLNNVFVLDHVNFTLLTIITCGTQLSQPRDIIFIENQNIMIIASAVNNKLVFFYINSPTNYTCLNTTTVAGNPQSLLKLNDSFFYLTTWSTTCVYNYKFDGHVWVVSLFTNVTQVLGISGIRTSHVHVDGLGRRWVMAPGFGLVVYDQWGNYLGQWKKGSSPFDIYISNDYRVIISDYGTASLSLYDPELDI